MRDDTGVGGAEGVLAQWDVRTQTYTLHFVYPLEIRYFVSCPRNPFVAPATPAGPDGLWRTSDDGLRLRSASPCIGAADPAVAPETDILGLPRSSPPDIGAYEFASGGGSWTLTYSAGAGGSISGTTPQTVASGADGSEVTAVPNTGYRFVRWSDDVMTASRTDTNVTADITVTAVFAHSKPAAVKDWPLYE